MDGKMKKCKDCGAEIPYTGSANFMIFCPQCLKEIYLECEYGYGPVAPCFIWMGNELFGTVIVENHNYFLEIQKSKKKMKLKETYFNALKEAQDKVERMLKKKKVR